MEDIAETGLPLVVAKNHENRGFGAACNQGVRLGSGDILLFLDPDAELRLGSLDEATTKDSWAPRRVQESAESHWSRTIDRYSARAAGFRQPSR